MQGRKTAADLALAGAFLTLAGDGSVRGERGYVRAEDEPKSKTKAKQKGNGAAKDADGLAPLSEKLVAELIGLSARLAFAQRIGTASGNGVDRACSRSGAGDVL